MRGPVHGELLRLRGGVATPVFGGLPTVVEGRPLWAAIVGLVGVVVGVVLIGMAVNSMIRERRARNRAGR